MIEFIEKQDHKTAILVHTLDRLQRGFSECEKIQQLLKADKIEVHFINEFLVLDKFSTDDEFARYDFGILAAKMYLTALNKNVKRSQKHNREAGNIVTKLTFNDGKVYINDTQYFDSVPEVAWNFYIGGYQPAQKWLKDRKGKELSFDDIKHYQKIINALYLTSNLMQEIDTISAI